LATDLEFGEQNPDEDEFLEVYKISLSEAVKMVMNGELPDSKTQTMILKINQLKNEGKI
jgi:ADP-ribose pyrophosphatase